MQTPAVSATHETVSIPPRIVLPQGPRNAPILIIGDYPSREDLATGRIFSSTSGQELSRILHDANILRSECYLTTLMRRPPPQNEVKNFFSKHTAKTMLPSRELEVMRDFLLQEIAEVNPRVIICLGDLSLWALTGNWGMVKWRGSILHHNESIVIPTHSPSAIMRQWEWRYFTVHDIRKAASYAEGTGAPAPVYNFLVRPSFQQVCSWFQNLSFFHSGVERYRIACDIETRSAHIACIGFALSPHEAICIPLMCTERSSGYWTESQEIYIVQKIVDLFRNKKIEWIFQNGLYDLQYFARHWGCVPHVHQDTMLAHHLCFSGMPKGLDFLSSLYCRHHVYWKGEGKLWDDSMNEEQLWTYNCKDAVITYEVSVALDSTVDKLKQRENLNFQMLQFEAVLRMMLRGVRQDLRRKGEFNLELMEAEAVRQQWIDTVVGRPFNVRSPKQMQEFLYNELSLPPQRNRKTGNISCDDAALEKLAAREPIFRPIYQRISELRSLGVFRSTFVQMRLDHDGRVRCSYNVAGTETFRYSSSEDAFGFGGNLQNIPSGDEAHGLPNVRKLFLPDQDCTIFDCDLDRADAQVVAWEANDIPLKEIFRAGLDMHLQNARDIFNNPNLGKDSKERKLAKAGCHAINYGAKPPTLSRALGITMVEAERFYNRWFALHPAIAEWHRRIESELATTRSVTNRFGYRRYYFSRVEGLLPEALAWVPQSTVALVIDKGLVNIDRNLRGRVDPLLQVHDSLVMQCKTKDFTAVKKEVREQLRIVIPYEDPLIIGVGIKASTTSWGDCEDIDWD